MQIKPKVARWAVPFLTPCRYKGAKGGRSGGKSHQLCELAAAQMAANPEFKVAGIREVQKSIKFSLKSLLEQKIHEQGASYLFDIQDQVIKRRGYSGVAAFLGMQDHTADSVKGLEDFDLGLVDEANALSSTSLTKLTPTFRKEGSEVQFAWNPDKASDPIDEFFKANEGHPDFRLIHVNIEDNPFASKTALAEYHREKARAEAARDRIAAARAEGVDPDDKDVATLDHFSHVWLGGYNKRSQSIVFHNWREGVLTPPSNTVWFYGVDWGFASDPLAATRSCFILSPNPKVKAHTLYVSHAISQVGVRTEDTVEFLERIPGIADWPSRADNARPELIDYCRRNGLPKMRAAKKGKGSVEDGVAFLQGLDIVVNPDTAKPFKAELEAYSYKVLKHTGEILPVVEDKHNHCIDGERYALEGAHRKGKLILDLIEDAPAGKRGSDYGINDDEDEDDSWKVV